MHGGTSLAGTRSPALKHGRYAKDPDIWLDLLFGNPASPIWHVGPAEDA